MARTGKLAAMPAGLMIATLVASCAREGSKGRRQTAKLTTTVADFTKSVRQGRVEIETTLASYDAIVNNDGGDLRKPYNTFSKGLEDLERRRERIRRLVDKMEVEADVFFASWERSLEEFTSEEMKQRSRQRMEETRKRYDAIHAEGEAAREAYAPFITVLRGQHLFLSNDLDASAATSLEKDAARIEKTSSTVYETIDAVIEAAEAYNASVAMRVEPQPACGAE